jgi:hypothetical protein
MAGDGTEENTMTKLDAKTQREPAMHPTRRDAVKAGGGAALALLAAGPGGGGFVIAQQATPATGSLDGAYAVIRFRELREDQDAEALLQLIRDGYVPLVREIPGFISYTAISDPASRNQAFIAVFEDQAGADESTRVAGDWLRDNQLDPFVGDPIVAEGMIAYAIDASSET